MKKISTIYLLTCMMITSYCLHGSEGLSLSLEEMSQYRQFVTMRKIITFFEERGTIKPQKNSYILGNWPENESTKTGLAFYPGSSLFLLTPWGSINCGIPLQEDQEYLFRQYGAQLIGSYKTNFSYYALRLDGIHVLPVPIMNSAPLCHRKASQQLKKFHAIYDATHKKNKLNI